MSVTVRLSRRGQKGKPFYRVVVTEKHSKRDGKVIDVIGTYNPMLVPPLANIKEDRLKHWIENGAQPTLLVANIVKKSFPGYLEKRDEHRLNKIKSARRARKERLKKLGTKKPAAKS